MFAYDTAVLGTSKEKLPNALFIAMSSRILIALKTKAMVVSYTKTMIHQ